MSFMDKATPKDLIKIIEACAKTGVSEFEMGAVKLKFTPTFNNFTDPSAIPLSWETHLAVDAPTENTDRKITPEQDQDLHLIDPVEWDRQAQLAGNE